MCVSTDTNPDSILVEQDPDASCVPAVFSVLRHCSAGTFPKFSPFLVCIHRGRSLRKVFRMQLAELPVPIRCVTCNSARELQLEVSSWCKRQRFKYAAAPRHLAPTVQTLSTERSLRCGFASSPLFLEEPLLSSVRLTSLARCAQSNLQRELSSLCTVAMLPGPSRPKPGQVKAKVLAALIQGTYVILMNYKWSLKLNCVGGG